MLDDARATILAKDAIVRVLFRKTPGGVDVLWLCATLRTGDRLASE